jgi:hypothetical protein
VTLVCSTIQWTAGLEFNLAPFRIFRVYTFAHDTEEEKQNEIHGEITEEGTPAGKQSQNQHKAGSQTSNSNTSWFPAKG